jgi:hypothetical protein
MTFRLHRITRIAAISFGSLVAAIPAFAGVAYQIETKEFSQSPEPSISQSTILVEGGNLKMSMTQGDNDQSGEMMEKMMSNRMPQGMGSPTSEAAIEIRETEEKADIGGYPTRKYEFYKEGVLQQEQWITPWSNIEGSDQVAQAFEGLSSLFAQFMKSMTQGPMGAMMAQRMSPNSWLSQMEHTRGLPVLTKMYEADGNLTRETRILGSENRSIDPSEFDAPKKYKRQKMDVGR